MLRKLCLLLLIENWILGQDTSMANIEKLFRERRVIPDVIQEPPKSLIKLFWPSPVHFTEPSLIIDKPGKVVTFDHQIMATPKLQWTKYDPNALYSLFLINPDVKSNSSESGKSEWLHWALQNIPGNQLGTGKNIIYQNEEDNNILAGYNAEYYDETLTEGAKRFVLLLYKQKSKLHGKSPQNYKNLGAPEAANFFYVRYPKIQETFYLNKTCWHERSHLHCLAVVNVKGIQGDLLQFHVKVKKGEPWVEILFCCDGNNQRKDAYRLQSNGEIIDTFRPENDKLMPNVTEESDDLMNKQFVTSDKYYDQYFFVRKVRTNDPLDVDFAFMNTPQKWSAVLRTQDFEKDMIRSNRSSDDETRSIDSVGEKTKCKVLPEILLWNHVLILVLCSLS